MAKCELKMCLDVFPTARHNCDIEAAVFDALTARGWDGPNTLFAHSTCPDEVNYDCPDTDLVNIMYRRWGEKFTLGGLAGMPFCGKTGWGAFSSHTPSNGNILILFAPHTGIGSDGTIGRLQRKGQDFDSACCGAAIAAHKCIAAPDRIEEHDLQQSVLMQHIYRDKQTIVDHPSGNEALGLVYSNYEIARNYLRQIIVSPEKNCSEIGIVGGIMVNLPDGIDDRFVPLDFEVLNGSTGRVDSFTSSFRGVCDEFTGWKAPMYEPFFNTQPHLRKEHILQSLAAPSTERSYERCPRVPGQSPMMPDMDEQPGREMSRAHSDPGASLSDGPYGTAAPPHAITVSSCKSETARVTYTVAFDHGGAARQVERDYSAFVTLKSILTMGRPDAVRAPFPAKMLLRSSDSGHDEALRRQLAMWLSDVVRTCWPSVAIAGFLRVDTSAAQA